MRAVAHRLGTGSGSLYRYVASRDELVALIGDYVIGGIRLERTGRGWRDDVDALMREMRRVILDQPLPPAPGKIRPAYGPNMLRMVDFALGLFLEAGLTNKQAAYTTITMATFVAGSAGVRRGAAGRGPNTEAGTEGGSAGLSQLLDGLPCDHFTALRAVGDDYTSASDDEVFTHGVTVFLDGVSGQLLGNR